jgi:hypothetical protein
MRFISSLGQQLLGLCHLILLLVQNRLCFSKTFNQYTFSLTLILAKNLVGKQFKGFYESKDLTDFENFKEGDKKIPYQVLAECKGRI